MWYTSSHVTPLLLLDDVVLLLLDDEVVLLLDDVVLLLLDEVVLPDDVVLLLDEVVLLLDEVVLLLLDVVLAELDPLVDEEVETALLDVVPPSPPTPFDDAGPRPLLESAQAPAKTRVMVPRMVRALTRPKIHEPGEKPPTAHCGGR